MRRCICIAVVRDQNSAHVICQLIQLFFYVDINQETSLPYLKSTLKDIYHRYSISREGGTENLSSND